MDCQRIHESMFLVSDNELEDEFIIVFREHLDCCTGCSNRFEYVTQLLTIVRKRCHRVTAPEGLEIRIRRSLHRLRGAATDEGSA
ncbi:MAG: hypothetical protein K8J08_01350 [Thermoanaerobaculia bacterium]|nr:hypothetical protein [Thermoanaerobaculia bacterium]